MSTKWNIDSVREFVKKESECKLLSNQFTRSRDKMIFLCPCGNEFEATFSAFNLKNKRTCNDCSKKRVTKSQTNTIEYVKDFIESQSDCKLLSTEYINCDTNLDIRCSCGSIFKTTFYKFKSRDKRQCNTCGHNNCGQYRAITNEEFISKVYSLVNDDYAVISHYRSSKEKVTIRHNICNHTYSVMPTSFIAGARCPKCARNQTIESDDFKEIFKATYDESQYSVVSKYSGYDKHITVRHSKCIHPDGFYEWSTTPSRLINRKSGCPYCNKSPKNKTTDDFKKELYQATNGEYVLCEGYEYTGARDKIKIKHMSDNCDYNEYYSTPTSILSGVGCNICNKGVLLTDKQVRKLLCNLTGDEFILLDTYVNSNTKHRYKHNINSCGHIFSMKWNDFNGGNRCPKCNESKGEKKISNWLTGSFIKYIPEKTFVGLAGVGGGLLRFDFYLPDYHLLIEYDGELHFVDRGFNDLKLQQYHDNIKNKYCKDNDIKLLRIPYWEFDNIEDILNVNLWDYNKKIL